MKPSNLLCSDKNERKPKKKREKNKFDLFLVRLFSLASSSTLCVGHVVNGNIWSCFSAIYLRSYTDGRHRLLSVPAASNVELAPNADDFFFRVLFCTFFLLHLPFDWLLSLERCLYSHVNLWTTAEHMIFFVFPLWCWQMAHHALFFFIKSQLARLS